MVSRKLSNLILAIFLIAVFLTMPLAVGCVTNEPIPETPVKPETSATPAMEPITLSFNGAMQNAEDIFGQTILYFCDEVTDRTDGLVNFTYNWSFSLTHPGEEIDAMNTGLSDMAFFPAVFYPAKLFLYNFDHCVLGGSTDYDKSILWSEPLIHDKGWMLHKEIENLNMKLLFAETAVSYDLESKMPITRLDDFKGKKIKVPGYYGANHVKAAGAAVLSPTMADISMMLETGALDGTITPRNVTFPFKIYEFATHNTPINWGCWLCAIGVIDLDLFNSFPEDIQQIFVDVGRESTVYFWEICGAQHKQQRQAMEDSGVIFHDPFPQEDQSKWLDIGGEYIRQWLDEAEEKGLGSEAKELMEVYFALQEEKAGHVWPDALKKQLN